MTKRPLVFTCIFYILGIILSQYNNLVIFTALLSLGIFFGLKLMKIELRFIVIFIFIFNLGFFYAQYKENSDNSKVLKYLGKTVRIEGTFLEFDKVEEKYDSFLINIVKINNKEIKPEKSRATYYNEIELDYRYGDLIVLNGQVEIPDGKRNPNAFDYKKYLKTRSIYSLITVEHIENVVKSGGNYSVIKKFSMFLREKIVDVINISMPIEKSALLEAILLSKKDSLDENVITNFQNAGLSHLMAVSGLHVGYVVALFCFIFKKLNLRQSTSTALLSIVLGLFILISGSRPSVIRAVIMCLMITYGKIFRRKSDVYTSIAFSALLILIHNPIVVYDLGFQLSYIATLSIVLFYKKVKNKVNILPKFFNDLFAVTVSAQIGVLPVSVYFFNNISIISFVTNLIAVPLSGIIVILGIVLVILGQFHIIIAKFFGIILNILLTILMNIARISDLIPFSSFIMSTPKTISIFIYYFVVMVIFFRFDIIRKYFNIKFIYKSAIGLGIILILFSLHKSPLEIHFLDVGQGDAAFIRTPSDKVILVDCGGFAYENSNAGEKIIIPFLLDKGIKKIDIMLISHTDFDHICGLSGIVDRYSVKNVIMSNKIKNENIFKLLNDNKINTALIKSGGKINIEKDISIDLICTPTKFDDPNDNESLICSLNYKNRKILFAGDISKNVEKEVLHRLNGNYDILKVAHHGSNTSSGEELLNKINPSFAIISVGEDNKFKHPSKLVLERLKDLSINTLRTDYNGCISVFCDGKNLKIKTMSGDKYEL